MAQKHSIVTVAGRNKEAAKTAANAAMVFTEIALGDGTRYPAGGETALENEVHRGQITGSGVEPAEPSAVWFDLYVPPETNTFYAQEIGLFDEDGVLYAISRFDQPVPKFGPDSSSLSDNTFRIVVIFADTENIVVQTSPVMGLTPETLPQHLPWASDAEAADEAQEKRIIDPKRLWAVLGQVLVFASAEEASNNTVEGKAVDPAGLWSVITALSENPVGMRATALGVQGIPYYTPTLIDDWQIEAGESSVGANLFANGVVTIKEKGLYIFAAVVDGGAGGTAYNDVVIRRTRGGVVKNFATTAIAGTSSAGTILPAVAPLRLEVDDQVDVVYSHQKNETIYLDTTNSFFSYARV